MGIILWIILGALAGWISHPAFFFQDLKPVRESCVTKVTQRCLGRCMTGSGLGRLTLAGEGKDIREYRTFTGPEMVFPQKRMRFSSKRLRIWESRRPPAELPGAGGHP